MKSKEEMARNRAKIILQVQTGELTATQGAQRLGLSRKTYYQWEKRGLDGMLKALEEKEAGRPEIQADPEKEALLKKVEALEKDLEVAKQSKTVQKLFHAWELQKARDRNKKKRESKKNRKR